MREGQGGVVGGAETILVAEDDDQVRVVVVETLKELGYKVLTASDAQSALAVLQSGIRIDLLFTDVVMPGPVRSPELAVKAREWQPGIAVLFTSGYTRNAIVHGGKLDEGVELLSKPYSREELGGRIRHTLANQARRADKLQDTSPGAAAGGGAATILLVERDELVRATATEVLQSLGHKVWCASGAEQALAILSTGHIEVLIVDVDTEEAFGGNLTHAARDQHPRLKMIVTGVVEQPGCIVDAHFLRKPYDTGALRAVLERLGVA